MTSNNWIGLWCAAALCVATALIGPSANAADQRAADARVVRSDDARPATDLSARRRVHRHVRHHRRVHRNYPGDYYARPHDYRPDGMTPFFPFYHGYGLEPSW